MELSQINSFNEKSAFANLGKSNPADPHGHDSPNERPSPDQHPTPTGQLDLRIDIGSSGGSGRRNPEIRGEERGKSSRGDSLSIDQFEVSL